MSYSKWSIVKARKHHRCLWCSEAIVPGEKHCLVEWAEGNTHGRDRFHMECEEAFDSADSDTIMWWEDEGCVPDFQRGHTHEEGSDTMLNEAIRGCPACRAALPAEHGLEIRKKPKQ